MIIFLPGTTFNHLQHNQPDKRSFLKENGIAMPTDMSRLQNRDKQTVTDILHYGYSKTTGPLKSTMNTVVWQHGSSGVEGVMLLSEVL